MMYDHDCDGECIVCHKPACEFCGTVATNSGNLYCSDHTFDADIEDYEENFEAEDDDDEDDYSGIDDGD